MAATLKRMIISLLILLVVAASTSTPAKTDPDALSITSSTECVILLHGFGRTLNSMKKIAGRLEALGYAVWNEGYPSTEKPIRTLVSDHLVPAVQWAEEMGANKIHFVTHSLGGILVRVYLQGNSLPPGSRIVMMAPPNRGSEVADWLQSFSLYKRFMGPAGQQLGTSPDSVPNSLKPVTADIGIIAGIRSVDPWFSVMIPGPDDGKVSVESAKLMEMNDFLTVKSTHPFIMRNPKVIDQVTAYLQNGRFSRNPQ